MTATLAPPLTGVDVALDDVYFSFDECPVDDYDPALDGDDSIHATDLGEGLAAQLRLSAAQPPLTVTRSLMSASTAPKAARAVAPYPGVIRLKQGGWMHGPAVQAYAVALWRSGVAEHRRGTPFRSAFGPGMRNDLAEFQARYNRRHAGRDLRVDGVGDEATFRALVPWFDARAIALLVKAEKAKNPLLAPQRRFVAAAMAAYNYRARWHYTQGPARMMMTKRRIRDVADIARIPSIWEDCSSTFTWLCFYAGVADPNGRDYDGLGYCHEPSARILTADLRWVPAGDVKVGDELWAFDDEPAPASFGSGRAGRRYRRATVIASFLSRKECVRVCLDSGESFVCSADHPWLTDTGAAGHGHRWTRADGLLPHQLVSHGGERHLVRPFIPWEPETSYEAGWLAGMFDGEGWVVNRAARGGRTNGIGITQALGPTADRLVQTARRYGDFAMATIERDGLRDRVNLTSNGGGMAKAAEFLGRIRAERLIAGFNIEGGHLIGRNRARVVAVEPVGMRDVQSIQTTEGTYFAEGFAVHNTGTLAQNGRHIWLKDVVARNAVGVAYLYGPGPTYTHVAGGVSLTRVVSHGSESGPVLLDRGYRTIAAVHIYKGLGW